MELKIKRKGNHPVMEVKEKSGATYLTFPSLEKTGLVTQLFSTRLGGVSKDIFATMNVSSSRGDDKEAVLENYRRIAVTMDRELDQFVGSVQTHTTNIRVVTKADAGKGIIRERDYEDIDGLVTNEPGLVLCTFYADCVPLYFLDTKKKVIGLSHSGWRGTVNKMGACTVQKMTEVYGTDPKDIVACIGPSICGSCYEVSEDVAEEFKQVFPADVVVPEYKDGNLVEGKYMLDLWKANRYVMLEAGIPAENIEVTDICTCCNPELLFSHRASHGKRGNLGAFLSLNPLK
ncbi:MAG: peptidoglycan editing factor PgeF [Lachnospiraceae bacterium]|nr:peptidoglycan editing factor PgeF [Lachnospiraceae bacterium]